MAVILGLILATQRGLGVRGLKSLLQQVLLEDSMILT